MKMSNILIIENNYFSISERSVNISSQLKGHSYNKHFKICFLKLFYMAMLIFTIRYYISSNIIRIIHNLNSVTYSAPARGALLYSFTWYWDRHMSIRSLQLCWSVARQKHHFLYNILYCRLHHADLPASRTEWRASLVNQYSPNLGHRVQI